MEKELERKCKHIKDLPKIPTKEELPAYREGVIKMKIPEFELYDNGDHVELGGFKVFFDDNDGFFFEWHIADCDKKKFAFSALCNKPELEFERLELGWLIGNIYSLNKIHDLESVGVPYNEYMFNERARLDNWYAERETPWYQWAVASPGQMIF